jgi:anti-sigma factor RsiW
MTGRPPGAPEPGEHQSDPCDVELLALFSIGELDTSQRGTVAAHLLNCDGCWDNVQAHRTIIGAVQQLWEPAPAGLRADLRAAVVGLDSVPVRRVPRARTALVASAAVAALAAGGLGAIRLLSRPEPHSITASPSVPAAVGAALAQSSESPSEDPSVPTAPDLSGLGLRLSASGRTLVSGVAASQYIYADNQGQHVTVFVSVQAWPRPRLADAVGARSWVIAPGSLTVVGGSDPAGDNMLIVADDHRDAMTAAATLGLV